MFWVTFSLPYLVRLNSVVNPSAGCMQLCVVTAWGLNLWNSGWRPAAANPASTTNFRQEFWFYVLVAVFTISRYPVENKTDVYTKFHRFTYSKCLLLFPPLRFSSGPLFLTSVILFSPGYNKLPLWSITYAWWTASHTHLTPGPKTPRHNQQDTMENAYRLNLTVLTF